MTSQTILEDDEEDGDGDADENENEDEDIGNIGEDLQDDNINKLQELDEEDQEQMLEETAGPLQEHEPATYFLETQSNKRQRQ